MTHSIVKRAQTKVRRAVLASRKAPTDKARRAAKESVYDALAEQWSAEDAYAAPKVVFLMVGDAL